MEVAEDPDAAGTGRGVIKVGVLVDLPLGPAAGGHVRCWERLAEAALGFSGLLDLTVHFSGPVPLTRVLGDSVRYVVLPPRFSTARLGFLSHVPDHTDLAKWHPELARHLPRYDVIHTTDAYFAYARTAMRVAALAGVPLVNSVHTNTPEYARIFTGQTIERLFGEGVLTRVLRDRLRVPERVERSMLLRLAAYQQRCAWTLVSRPEQLEPARATLGERVSVLRRGIDHTMFTPSKRDRAWLARCYGIAPERFVVICAGRLNRGKNVVFLADVIAALLAQGVDVQLVCAGEGSERAAIERRLQGRATCPGVVGREELARLYASADVFAFPSLIEESANVVYEAQSSGLPALVTRAAGMGRAIREGETGFVLSGGDPALWVSALAQLAADPDRRRGMAAMARHHAERAIPSWAAVLREDLLPHWQAVVGRHTAQRVGVAA
ncbi:MAG TPA: glycosyltransferase [Stellaceae bacterium]|nr:glycosyltransferase [Stellaceae bacterium]